MRGVPTWMTNIARDRAERARHAAELAAIATLPAFEDAPPGTPNRKIIHRERMAARRAAIDAAMAAAGFSYSAFRDAEIKRLRQEEKAAKTPAQKEAESARRRIFTALRKLGFKREHTSGASAYYSHIRAGLTVRISDHDVPMTAEREHNLAHGGRSWANSRFSFVLGDGCEAEWLEDVTNAVAARMEIYAS